MTIDDLIAIREIEQLKYRYMRAVDTQDWRLMETCFAEDATSWYGDGLYSFAGREAILGFFRDVLNPSFVSSHLAVHPEITLTGPDSATGVWRMVDIVHYTEPNPSATEHDFKGGEELEGAGYYYDDYGRRGGEWVIARTGYVRIYDAVTPGDARPGHALRIAAKRGKRL